MGVPIWKINGPDGLMDGWALKWFYGLVYVCDEMWWMVNGLKENPGFSYCNRVDETVKGWMGCLFSWGRDPGGPPDDRSDP